MPEQVSMLRAAHFVSLQGKVLEVDQQVTVDRLPEILASASSPEEGEQFFLDGLLNADDMDEHSELLVWEELPATDDGGFELELAELCDALRRMLSASRDLDAHVRLRIGSNRESLPPRSLHVTRFDVLLDADREGGEVVLEPANPGESLELDNLRIEAIRLWDPTQAADLPRCGNSRRWSFDAAQREPGRWLILGWDGERCRARPLVWTVEGQHDAAQLDELQQASFLEAAEERSAAIAKVFDRLAGDPEAPEWSRALDALRLLEHLPPAVNEPALELIKSPPAAATALMAAGARLPLVWKLLEELSFGWWQISVRTWVQTAKIWLRKIRRARAKDEIPAFFEAAAAQGRFLEPVGEWTRVEVLGESINRTQLAMGLEIPRHVLEQERQALFHRTPERWWPQGDLCVRWLKEKRSWMNGGMAPLRQVTIGVPRFKRPVLAAPVVAALSAAFDAPVDRAIFYELRRLRDFDREWFDAAHMLVLRIAVGVLMDENPDVLR